MRPVPFVASLLDARSGRRSYRSNLRDLYPQMYGHDTIAAMEGKTPDYMIIFDGGSRGNPGQGYGSYEVRAGTQRRIERLDFGDRVTNNEAEYRTLIAALRDVLDRIAAAAADPKGYTIAVRGDSQLVIFQVLGKWKVKTPHIRPLHTEAAALLGRFKRADVQWQPRAMSVRTLGH